MLGHMNVKNIVYVCPYSYISYPICKSHLFCVAQYCHLWRVWFNHIFPLFLINGTIFGVRSSSLLRAADQQHLESFEMWCWRRMEKISWTDHVRNE